MIKKISIFLSVFLTVSLLGSKTVIFDFGGVLGYKNRRIAASKLGMIGFGTALTFFTNPKIFIGTQSKLYKYLEKIPASERAVALQNSSLYADDDDGNKIPPIMVDWLLGEISGKELIDKLDKVEFESKSDKEIMLKAAGALLPENLSEIMELNTSMINLVKECKKRGHRVILLSNFDVETFKLLKQKHSKALSIFDAIYLSADLNMIKPCQDIFHTVLEKEDLVAKDCVFVDDSKQNIEIAEKLGIPSIRHTDPAKTTKLLKKLI